MQKIRIKKGTYRKTDVSGTIAEMIEPAKKGFYKGKPILKVTVNGEVFGHPNSNARVLISSEDDYEKVDSKIEVSAPVFEVPEGVKTSAIDWTKVTLEGDVDGETEKNAIERINERFSVLDELTFGVGRGHIRGLVVSGAPGVGKSFGVEKCLTELNVMNYMADKKPTFDIVKGTITPIMLFIKLYAFSNADQILVFDDCDSVFFDGDALNMLKAALDTGKRRYLSYNSDSRLLAAEGIPNHFEFKGSVIFITNLKPETTRSEKIKAHVQALFDRVLSLDLTIDTPRDRFLRVKSVALGSGMLDEYDLKTEEREEIVDFIRKNIGKLKNGITLRTVLNLADLMRMKPDDWQYLARNTLLKRI